MNIGEAAKRSGLTAKMIRYYEASGLISPAGRGANGYRRYNEDDLAQLLFIRRARDMDFSLDEVGQLLTLWQNRQSTRAEVRRVAATHIAELERKIADMQRLRDSLQQLVEDCAAADGPGCPILRDLEAGGCPGGKKT